MQQRIHLRHFVEARKHYQSQRRGQGPGRQCLGSAIHHCCGMGVSSANAVAWCSQIATSLIGIFGKVAQEFKEFR
jgi:hypothetical protein